MFGGCLCVTTVGPVTLSGDPRPLLPRPGAAAEWLQKAFGFTVRLRIANHRIQMRAGQGCITVREGNIVPNRSCIVQVRIDDALGHCERARHAGAKILTEPVDHNYGERQYNAEDFYGHRWDFTETLHDVDPEAGEAHRSVLALASRVKRALRPHLAQELARSASPCSQ